MTSITIAGISLEACLAIFVVVWWTVFLMALPFGVARDEDPAPGTDPGAPAKPHLRAKVLATTAISLLVTWGIAWLLGSGAVQFRGPAP